MRTKIQHVILTPGVENEEHIPFVNDAELQIDGNRIVYAGSASTAPAFSADEVIDGSGCLAMPGLINMHTHTPMTLLRGVGGGLTLERWLHEAIFPREACLTDESVRAGSDLGVAEMLRFGTTTFNDMYMHMDALAESVRDSGIRATLAYSSVDFDGSCRDFPPAVEFAEKWHHTCDDRIHAALAPHAENTTTPAILAKTLDASQKMDLPIHIHVSETKLDHEGSLQRRGKTPVAYLESLGLLERPVIAAHCVWCDENDIQILQKHQVAIVHNPASNLKLASGVAPISRMLDAGCRVTLGTDGVASNNDLNLWEALRMMPLLQKGTLLDPCVVSPAQAFAAATYAGALALGYHDLGLLKPGYLADIVLVDLHTPQCFPCQPLEEHLIYSVQGADVRMTMVDGRVLYRDGRYLTLDIETVLARASAAARTLTPEASAADRWNG